MTGAALLEMSDVRAGYGAATDAISDISLSVGRGEAVGILGANGAGKSTLLKVLGGMLPPRGGQIRLHGKALPKERPPARMRRGVVLLPEGHRVIGTLTVEENLRLGAIQHWPRQTRTHLQSVLPEVYDLFPVLAERRTQLAGFLSGGEQQMVGLGRALIAKPRVLLLDEPSLGLAPVIVERIYEALERLRERDLSIVILEQNAGRLEHLCDRVHVLRLGRIAATMQRGQIDHTALRAAYFGDSSTAPAGDAASDRE
jgi:branched-chain amino acid transport system ATP-binding protein